MRKRIASAMFVVLWLTVSVGVGAQAPRELTALDYFEIQQLIANYARAIDTCSNNGYDYADLFTPDGAFIPSFDGKPGAPLQGRERLATISGGGTNGCKNVPWIEQGVRHIYTNHVITPTAEGATGVVDMLHDRTRRRPQQDRVRRPLRGHVRAHGAGLALQAARAPRPAARRTTRYASRPGELASRPLPLLTERSRCTLGNQEEKMSKPADLVQGTLDLLILKMLALKPMHGWTIGQRLKELSSDVLQVSDGSLYPALHKLEQEGWISAEWKPTENNRRAKFYSLTPIGKKALRKEADDWNRLSAAISYVVGLKGA